MIPISYIPSPTLKPYVKHIAVYENAESSVYRVLPDTLLVMGFQYKGKLAYLDNDIENKLDSAGISGLTDKYRLFKNAADTGTVLVVFEEAGAAAFFKDPLHELFSESLSLDNFITRTALQVTEEKLCEAATNDARVKIVEQFLISRLRNYRPDVLVAAALQHIHQSKGTMRISDLAQKLNISQSPLEKRFRQAVGASPKKFSSIVRFRHIMEQQQSGKNFTGIGYDAGYFDQAHFIKDFKAFTGQTPDSFFKGGV